MNRSEQLGSVKPLLAEEEGEACLRYSDFKPKDDSAVSNSGGFDVFRLLVRQQRLNGGRVCVLVGGAESLAGPQRRGLLQEEDVHIVAQASSKTYEKLLNY